MIWSLHELLAQNDQSGSTEIATLLSDAQTWLAGQAKREEGGVSWDSEAWDTSLSIIALAFGEQFAERRDQAAAWLQRIRCPTVGVWYDEVWETTLCAVALLRAEATRRGPIQPLTHIFRGVLAWINDLPSKLSGEFINPHYSGFIVWLTAEILASPICASLVNTKEFKCFETKVSAATAWLLERAASSPETLWSPYTFSNAYVAYGLCKLYICREQTLPCAASIINWFKTQQGQSGGFEDTEDTAIAILALTRMGALLRINSSHVLKALPKPCADLPVQRQHRCFMGYSGKSSGIALGIKEFLSRVLPTISLHDWKWDFQVGQILFSELDAASKECNSAIFLITKDDQLLSRSLNQAASPRDNVVFEVGFFAARVGMANTILIVEDGTKVPTDWGGILYIPLRDRNQPESVYLALQTKLKRLFSI